MEKYLIEFENAPKWLVVGMKWHESPEFHAEHLNVK